MGLTKREHFAMAAMQAILADHTAANLDREGGPDTVARYAVRMADVMLAKLGGKDGAGGELTNGTRVRVVRDEPHSADCKSCDEGAVWRRRADLDVVAALPVYEVRMPGGELWALTEGEDFEVVT